MPPEARLGAWVADEAGNIVGWSRSLIRFEESGGSATAGACVLPPWRRRGIGTALLQRALDHVADAPRAFAFSGADGRTGSQRHTAFG